MFLTDMLISEYKERFENTTALPLLHILPDSATDDRWIDNAEEWAETVLLAADLYKDLLPSAITLRTELFSWRNHW